MIIRWRKSLHSRKKNPHNIKAYYEKYWKNFKDARISKSPFSTESQENFFIENHSDFLAQMFLKAPGKLVLNLGCGKGTHSMPMERRGFRVVNIDYSSDALLLTKEYYLQNGIKPLLVKGDINFLPFRPDCFDIVMNFGVMEHFEIISPIYMEMISVLKRKGVLHSEVITKRLSVNALERFIAILLSFFYNLLSIRLHKLRKLIQIDYKKEDFYENSYSIEYYIQTLQNQGISKLDAIAIRPYPFIRLPNKLDSLYSHILIYISPLFNKMRGSRLSRLKFFKKICAIWLFYGIKE